MKVASFFVENPDKTQYGIVNGDRVITPNTSFIKRYPSIRDVIEGDAFAKLDKACDRQASYSLADVTLLPPILNAR